MMDKTHSEQIERWAKFVRENPNTWKAKVKPFMDGQIIMARRFYKKLLEEEGGKEKVRLLRGLKG